MSVCFRGGKWSGSTSPRSASARVKAETALAEAALVPAVLEFLKAGPQPILASRVTDAFPGSWNASGRVARQLADDGRVFQTGKAPSEAARVLAGRRETQARVVLAL